MTGETNLHLRAPERCPVRDGAAPVLLAEPRRELAETRPVSAARGRAQRRCIRLEVCHEVPEVAHFPLELLRFLADLDELCPVLVDILLQVGRNATLELLERGIELPNLVLRGVT